MAYTECTNEIVSIPKTYIPVWRCDWPNYNGNWNVRIKSEAKSVRHLLDPQGAYAARSTACWDCCHHLRGRPAQKMRCERRLGTPNRATPPGRETLQRAEFLPRGYWLFPGSRVLLTTLSVTIQLQWSIPPRTCELELNGFSCREWIALEREGGNVAASWTMGRAVYQCIIQDKKSTVSIPSSDIFVCLQDLVRLWSTSRVQFRHEHGCTVVQTCPERSSLLSFSNFPFHRQSTKNVQGRLA